MPTTDVSTPVRTFVCSAVEAFGLAGPIYQFSFGPAGEADELPDGFEEGAEYVRCRFGVAAEIPRLPFCEGAARTLLCLGLPGDGFRSPQSVDELLRILAPGGAMLVCVAVPNPGGRPMPRFSLPPAVCSVQRLMDRLEIGLLGWQDINGFPAMIYGVGFRPPLGDAILRGINPFLDRCCGGQHDDVQFVVHWRSDRDVPHLVPDFPPDAKTGSRLDLRE
jgi:hypothetical protein